MPDLLTTSQFADRLGVTGARVKQLIEAGVIRATRFGNTQKSPWMIDARQLRIAAKRPGRGRPKKLKASAHQLP